MTRTKHPAAAMLLGVVASTGELCPPIWFPKGFRLNLAGYIEALKKTIIPWMRDVAVSHGRPGHPAPFVYQQDSAPAHRSRQTLDFLRQENIPFWPPGMWPPSSPDIAPMDFGVWPMVAAAACKNRSSSVPVLKRRVNATWNTTEPAKI